MQMIKKALSLYLRAGSRHLDICTFYKPFTKLEFFLNLKWFFTPHIKIYYILINCTVLLFSYVYWSIWCVCYQRKLWALLYHKYMYCITLTYANVNVINIILYYSKSSMFRSQQRKLNDKHDNKHFSMQNVWKWWYEWNKMNLSL